MLTFPTVIRFAQVWYYMYTSINNEDDDVGFGLVDVAVDFSSEHDIVAFILNKEQRPSSFKQLLNPVLRRRISG